MVSFLQKVSEFGNRVETRLKKGMAHTISFNGVVKLLKQEKLI